jgi:RNA polymerase sigma-70 factor (ECF subfamily)
MDEKEIILQCRQGNSDAFARLVDHFQYRVIAVACNITGDPEEARDVAQDAFAQAFINLDTFDLNRNFKKWLMGITVKRSIDRLRKSKSFIKFFKAYIKMTPLVQNPKTRMIEDSLILQGLLKKLNTKERSILALQINEGFSARELGNIFNCSENTIRVHLFRARQKLKKALKNNPGILGKKEVIK